MKGRSVAVVVGVIVVVVGGALWFVKSRQRDTAATATVTQGSAPAVTPRAAATQPAASAGLRVTVRDQAGPLADAYVRLAPEDGEVIAVKTGRDGVASAEKLAAGTYAISASAAGHEPAAAPARTLAAGERGELTIELAAGGRLLSGVVTDVSGGAVAGARVDAAGLGALTRLDRAVATTITGADGKYQLAVTEGQLLVAARSADYAPQSRVVDVGPSGATADFALVPGGVIEGSVLDETTRQPVPHAIVNARRDSAAVLLAETAGTVAIAGADGKFRLPGLRPGAYELAATGDGRRSKASTIVGLGIAEQVGDVELLVGRAPVVRGTVIDDRGAPVTDARVLVMGDGGGEDTKCDDHGAFVIEGLAPAKYMLIGSSPEHISEEMQPIEVKDMDVDDVVVRVRRGAKVIGRVEPPQVCDVTLDPDETSPGGGLPVLRAMRMSAPNVTGPDGRFAIGPAEDGKQTIAARCASGDQGTATADVKPGMGEVVVVVKPGAAIAGRVLDKDGKPVGGVTVSAAAQDGGERTMIVNGMVTSGVHALTSANGAYTIRGLAPGAYRASVLDRGRPMAGKPKKVTLAAGETKAGVDLTVERPNGVIKGVVQGADGRPLADAWVSVHQDLEAMVESMVGDRDDEPGDRSMMMRVEANDGGDGGGLGGASDVPPTLTDAQGRFEIRGLPKLKFDVVAEARAGKLRGRQLRVEPDAEITIRAAGVTSLSGTVTSATGPAKLFTIVLDGPTRTQRTFTDGRFELGRVDPGSYTVKVMSDHGNAEVAVQVLPGQPATVSISLVANAIVVGTVVDAHGKPVAGVPVTVVDDHDDGRIQVQLEGPPPTSGPDGKFRVEHKAGRGVLVVMTPPRPVTQRGLELAAGKTLDVGAVRVEAPPPP